MRGFDPSLLPMIYAAAVLLPLASFFIILLGAKWLGDKASWIATGAIGGAGILSFIVLLGFWLPRHFPAAGAHHGEHEAHAEEGGHDAEKPHGDKGHSSHESHDTHGNDEAGKSEHAEPEGTKGEAGEKHSRLARGVSLSFVSLVQEGAHAPAESHATEGDAEAHDPHHAAGPAYTGEYYTLGQFGPLRITISYYIDSLTVIMFCMVTLIATCIHFYAIGYMHDELHDVTDNEVMLSNGDVLRRPGRFPRFFQYLSLFCFSMLGLVLAGNIAMVFVFWELVGICSYFLIGFYIERKSASTAANKAFIVNRVGDFGMIIGLMALWSTLGTFAFGDIERTNADGNKVVEAGIFSQVRPGPEHALIVPAGMVHMDAQDQVATIYREHSAADAQSELAARTGNWRSKGYGYWLLVVAGIGVFCGCVGKSAQFPLHVWLPDAMEGPTPVSALVHSATMVAAGVYLVGRFFPVFAPEVLLVIATIGCITMLLGASIAFTANDIKRVLAYSTVSQLGLMMLALGVGGWLAGLMHLVTHAFFKSLLFMCSGSVIHAVHTNDMRKMGGLFWKMPVTAITMLIGCLAIAGVAVPFVVGFSGYYSKDAILEQALSFWNRNGSAWAGLYFVLALAGAAMTTCYMFRMWFLTFVGKPRDHHAYDHAHESPPVMVLPLVILSILAISVAWNIQLIGYGLVAAGFFIALGIQQGWFQRLPAAHGHMHGHDAHGHDVHGHEAHGQGDQGHDTHAHETHGHAAAASHALADHDEPAASPFTWGWLATMLLASLIGGALIDAMIGDTWLDGLSLAQLLEQSRPLGTLADARGQWIEWTWPNEHDSHVDSIRIPATLLASGSWIAGILIAAAFYWWRFLSADEVRRQFAPVYSLLVNKWWFDELYGALFVRPAMLVGRVIAAFDRNVIDGAIDSTARGVTRFSRRFEYVADQTFVDGLVNLIAGWTYSLGLSLRAVQTGRIRQYVMFIVVGAIAIFVLISFFWNDAKTLTRPVNPKTAPPATQVSSVLQP